MRLDFVPLTAELIPACRAFNERLRRHGDPPFVLPEEPPPAGTAPEGGITWSHHVALDETGGVRGGVLLMEQRGWLGQSVIPLVNVQSPLSEGTVDRAYAGVALCMLQFLTRRSPYVYAVGMGTEQNPFARLLAAAGWPVTRVPFQYAVIRAGRFLREAGPLRHGGRKWGARLAAASGLGAVVLAAWRLARRPTPLRGYTLEAASAWPTGLDEVWERCRGGISFSAMRDARAANALHPESQARLRRFVLRRSGEIAGWSVGLVTQMKDSPYFGSLVVGTILDTMAAPEHRGALAALTQDALCELGCDLLVTNQTHGAWRQEFRRLGFLSGPSNYLLAVSKPVGAALQSDPAAPDRVYVTRGDGDGRIHL